MDSQTGRRRGGCRGLVALSAVFILIGTVLPTAMAMYSVGVGIADATGPVAEIVFVRESQIYCIHIYRSSV